MAKVTPINTNFSAGEFSPLLDGRTDIEKYYNAVKTLENFIILPQGGIKRRPGTYYVSEVKDSTRKTRLIPFQFSTTQAYIIEVGDRYFRFYYNNGQLLSSGSAYELTTPYLEADIFDLQFAQDADTMWITHPSYKPRKLTRNAASWDSYVKLMLHCDGADESTTFTDEIGKTVTRVGTAQIDTAQYKFGGASGLFDGDSDCLTVPDSADWYFGTGDFTIDFWVRFSSVAGTQTLIAQYEAFNKYWAITRDAATGRLTMAFVATGVIKGNYYFDWTPSVDTWYHLAFVRSGPLGYMFINGVSQTPTVQTAFGTNDVGNFAGLLYIGQYGTDVHYTNGWIDEIRISKGIARWTANFTPLTVAYAADVITFNLDNYAPELMTLDVAPGGSGWTAGDTITGNTSGKTCKIVSVTDTTHYRVKDRSGAYTLGEVLTNGTATADQGAAHPIFAGDPFGADGSDDCPSCVAIFEQRILFANTNNNPQKVWGSVAGDYEDMTTGADASDAYIYIIGSEQVNAIKWMTSGRTLLLGTLGGLFSMSSGSDLSSITPTNVTVKREATYGSTNIVPRKIGNYVYYVQRNLTTLRETAFNYNDDEYKAFNMTILAPHITGDGIVDMAYQQSPYNILWCVRSDGKICTLTREIDQEVIAWSRQTTKGNFESVAVIPEEGGDDEVWFIVNRTVDGSTVRYVEYLKPMDFGTEQEDAFFVDSGLSLDTAFNITGITQANPGVVTTEGDHGLSDDDIVILRGVVGMIEVNQRRYKVANKTGTTFELTDVTAGTDIDTSDYTAYSSGGEVRECSTSPSGLSHLKGKTVDVLVDGVETTKVVSSGGVITLTSPGGGEVHAGLSFVPTVQLLRLEAGSEQGSAQGKVKSIQKVIVRVYNSIGMNVGSDITQDAVEFRDATDDTDLPIPLKSQDYEVPYPGSYDKKGYVKITQSAPQPLTILAVILFANVFEN